MELTPGQIRRQRVIDGEAPAPEIKGFVEELERQRDYLREEINRMRRVLQETDMWDQFVRYYGKRYPVGGAGG